jgi:crotonobetainyl-CoA:carnitine CoA-transferase CaiB-like acyl-CoA transferase
VTSEASLLSGLRVLEVATVVAAPTVGAILAEYGADVTHIEEPVHGDPHRHVLSRTAKPTDLDADFNSSWELINRNKRSLALSLKAPEGQAIFRRLIAQSDVFICNLLPDAQRRLGVDYATLRELDERLIHISVSGWGSEGPFRNIRSYDFTVYWAASGQMSMMQVPGSPPGLVRPGMGDRPTGLAATAALGMALYYRERTGKGQAIEVSLLHTGLFTLASDVQRAMVYGEPMPRYARSDAPGPLLNSYPTADDRWLLLNVGQPDWTAFCTSIGEPELAGDSRFATIAARAENNHALIERLDAAFRKHDLAYWTERFNADNVTWAPALEPLEAAQHPQSVANEFFIDAHHTAVGPYKVLSFPFKFSAAPPQFRNQAPAHGEQTREILSELGISSAEIQALADRGVVNFPRTGA